MKYLIIAYFTFLFISCNYKTERKKINTELEAAIHIQATNTFIDSIKSSNSLAILKAKLLKFGDGDKYLYAKINVLEVLMNKTNYSFQDTIYVAHYSWKSGIPPNKECTIYLSSWPYGSNTLNEKGEWMLIEGDGEYACQCE